MTKRPSNLPIDAIQKNTPLDGVEQSFRVDTPLRNENRALDVAVATGAPINDTVEKVSYGDNSPLIMAKSQSGNVVNDTIQGSLDNNVPPEEAAVLVGNAQEKKSAMDAFSDFVLEGVMTVGDPNYNPALARLSTNQQIAMEVMEERFKASNDEKGAVGTTLDFIDRYLLRQIGIGTVEDLWGRGRTQRKGLELVQAGADMSADEYREYITAYADELAGEGIFRGDNWFALQQGLAEAQNAGYDPDARALEMLSILDVIGVGGAAKGALSGGAKLLGRVAKVRGVRAADEAAEVAIKSGATEITEVADELLPAHLQIGKVEDTIVPTQGRVQKVFSDNAIIKEVQDLWNKGTFGRAASSEQVQLIAGRISQTLTEVSSRPLARTDVVDLGLGESALSAKFGKMKDGLPFTNSGNAEKFSKQLQEKGLSARVVTVDASDANKGYYVEVLERMDLSKSAAPINVEAAYGNILQNVTRGLSSARATDDPLLSTLANLGESGNAAVGDIVKPLLKDLRKLPLDSKKALDGVMRQLRDGKDAYLKEAYTEVEFRANFALNHPTGKQATDADVDAYFKLQSMNDAAYVFEANKLVKRYVTKGYKGIEINGVTTPAKKFNGVVPAETQVLDASTGRMIDKAEIREGEAIWKLEKSDQGVEYVSRPSRVAELSYDDVLPYNAGGRRINPDARYFVTSGEGRGRALFAAYTEKQAILGSKQVGEIFKMAKAAGKNLDGLGSRLDDVIKRNNDWNPSIENTADFVALAKRKGWTMDEVVSYKARDGIVEATSDEVASGMTYGEYTMAAKGRQDDVLMNFGGDEVNNHSPLQAITDQLSSGSMNMSMSNYSNTAKAAWLKKAMRVAELPADMDVNRAFAEMGKLKGNGTLDRRLNSLRGIIERREGVKGELSQRAEDLGVSVREFVFDTTGSKAGAVAEGAEGKLLSFGFQSAFSGNLSQLFLQATHAPMIIAASPLKGGQGAAMAATLGFIRKAPVKSQKVAMERTAKFFGMKPKELEDIADFMRTSGRQNIEADSIERGVGGGFGADSISRGGQIAGSLKNVGDILLTPFNVGEAASRQTGMLTAILEYKGKFPKADIFGDDARAWITRREQDLTFNMTTANRAEWQHGLMKVPTQWLSYMLRSFETVFVGKGFTAGERARMGLMMAAGGGMAGLGMSKTTDYLAEKFGMEPDSVGYNALKNGVYDGILSWSMSEISGEQVRTAFGTRIAPFAGIIDLSQKLNGESPDSSFWGIVGGPSGEMAAGTIGAVVGLGSNITSGNYQASIDDIMRVIRQPSGVDNIVKAIGIANYGMYRSKTGTVLPVEMDKGMFSMDAMMAAAGITNFKVAEFYDRRTQAFSNSADVKAFSKEMVTDFRRGLQLGRTDPARGEAMLREVEARIEVSPFSPYDKMLVRRALKDDTSSDLNQMALEAIRRGNDFGAKVIEGLQD